MLVIGLTGGIGSGKTSVANLFAERGINIIDTDLIARDITNPNLETFQKIIQQFGPEVLTSDKSLDRRKLRKIIFKDNSKRIWLENLLHPLIREEMHHQIKKSKSPYCIAIIPLLFETSPNPFINRVLVIDTSEENQISRTQMRDQHSIEEVKAILKAQVSREKRLEAADDVIQNNGSLQDLSHQVENLHHFYLNLAAQEPN